MHFYFKEEYLVITLLKIKENSHTARLCAPSLLEGRAVICVEWIFTAINTFSQFDCEVFANCPQFDQQPRVV